VWISKLLKGEMIVLHEYDKDDLQKGIGIEKETGDDLNVS
jgi:hypothetical protein